MRPTFEVAIATPLATYRTVRELLHEPALRPVEQFCREHGVRFRCRRSTTNGRNAHVIWIIGGDAFQPLDTMPAASDAERLMRAFAAEAEYLYIYVLDQEHAATVHAPLRAIDRDVVERLSRVAQQIGGRRCTMRTGVHGTEELARLVRRDLRDALEPLCTPPERQASSVGPYTAHEEAVASHCVGYIRVSGHFEKLDAWLARAPQAAVLTGQPGVGKSSLLANWSEELRQRDRNMIAIRHFVEVDGPSPGHAAVLRHVLSVLRERGVCSGPIPSAVPALEAMFREQIAGIRDLRVLLIIDGLDQLCRSSQELHWLPRQTSGLLRLIVSAAPGRACDRARARGWHHIESDPPPDEVRRRIIERFVRYRDVGISNAVAHRIAAVSRNDTVAGLRGRMAAAEEAASSADQAAVVEALLAPSPEAAIRYVLARWSSPDVVGLLRLLWGARRGLSERELQLLLDVSPDRCAALLHRIRYLLAPHDDLIAFAHPSVRIEVGRRLVRSAAAARRIHVRLATYFVTYPACSRRAEEEPWQWMQAKAWTELRACIEEPDMFLALTADGREYELLEYWKVVADTATMANAYRATADRIIAATKLSAGNVVPIVAMLERLAAFTSSCGLYAQSELFLEQVLALRLQYLPGDRVGLAGVQAALGETLRRAGRLRGAVELLEEARGMLCDVPDAQISLHAQVANDLGLALREAGDNRALEYFREAVRSKVALLGNDHPSTAETLNDMALVYHDRGDIRAAIELYQEALEIQQRHTGEDHPAVATYLNNLAGARRVVKRPAGCGVGHLATALTLYRQALEIRERLLGADHPHTLLTLTNLASLHYERSEHDDARAACSVLRIHLAGTVNDDHPHTLAINVNLAQLLQVFNEIDEAYDLLMRTLGACTRTLGLYHRTTAVCLNNLARLLRRAERYVEAESYYVRAVDVWRAVAGPADPQVATTLFHRAFVLRRLGCGRDAIPICAEALTIQEATLELTDPRTCSTLHLLGVLQEECGLSDEARRTFQRYLERAADANDDTLRDVRARLTRLERTRRRRK